MVEAAIAIGSNIPPRRQHLEEALRSIASLKQCGIHERSLVYETDPVGGPPQGRFLNAAFTLRTSLPPLDLLHRLLSVEQSLGRIREEQCGPRTMDLDIIFYGRLTLSEPRLEVPHPRFRERGFVLIPLHDIIPGFVDPRTGKTVAALLEDWKKAGGGDYEALGPL